ncbi:MAG: hypothetical protein IK080_07060 [Clostridia bacterium]|nr:hypothetical protein [Clostridia bacterium]
MKYNVVLKKGWAAVLASMIFLFSLIGCGRQQYPPLPQDAIAFEMGTYEDAAHDDALFGTIEYSGRVYVAYGTISNSYRPKDAETCIGYIVQDENSASVVDPENKDRRIYTVTGDPDHNFLLEYDATIKLMYSPTFYRALDTNGQEIEIPEFITPLGYELWQS